MSPKLIPNQEVTPIFQMIALLIWLRFFSYKVYVTAFLQKKNRCVNHEQLIDDLEAWNNKCDSEIEKKELDLKNLKKEKENKQGDFEELKLNFASYKAVVVEDRTEKERIKREKEELERQMKACVQMQAWWRGTMVRKGFGEFKKGGKKGKKGKGGKKGKKGKK